MSIDAIEDSTCSLPSLSMSVDSNSSNLDTSDLSLETVLEISDIGCAPSLGKSMICLDLGVLQCCHCFD